jgi:NTP pyrophosphatase (non-canonical NTP hydrolase)
MDFKEYQERANETAIYPPVLVPGPPDGSEILQSSMLEELEVVYPALGLAGEAGEFANKVKKIIRDNQGKLSETVRQDLLDELGDVLWYVAACVSDLDGNLEEVAIGNVLKLQSRKERNVIGGSGDNR